MNEIRLYKDRANWWPLFSDKDYYPAEAETVLQALQQQTDRPAKTILELGSGGGSLASHLKRHAKLTLVDLSPDMLEVSQKQNPGLEHIPGDMRTIRLDRVFDSVVIHDAVNYMTTIVELIAALSTARAHLEPGGAVIVLPDDTTESFKAVIGTGGRDGEDGRSLRYLSWLNGPEGNTYTVDFAILLKDNDGSVECLHERHVFGLFSREEWCAAFEKAGFCAPNIRSDRWRNQIFLARAG